MHNDRDILVTSGSDEEVEIILVNPNNKAVLTKESFVSEANAKSEAVTKSEAGTKSEDILSDSESDNNSDYLEEIPVEKRNHIYLNEDNLEYLEQITGQVTNHPNSTIEHRTHEQLIQNVFEYIQNNLSPTLFSTSTLTQSILYGIEYLENYCGKTTFLVKKRIMHAAIKKLIQDSSLANEKPLLERYYANGLVLDIVELIYSIMQDINTQNIKETKSKQHITHNITDFITNTCVRFSTWVKKYCKTSSDISSVKQNANVIDNPIYNLDNL